MYVGMFISRNKDNENVANFHSRSELFFMETENFHDYQYLFKEFVNKGVPGEMSRFYVSISPRNMEKTQKELACRLIKDSVDLSNLNNLAISIAMKAEQEVNKKWLFDFDCCDSYEVTRFCMAIRNMDITADYYHTPNGFSVVVEHGFDCRYLLETWNSYLKTRNPKYNIELKRNAMQVVMWDTKFGE